MNKSSRKSMNYKFLMIFFAVIIIGFVFLDSVTSYAGSSYPYLIKVNRRKNCITIYEKDSKGNYSKPVKAIVCSTGGSLTPLGTYRTPAKYRWKLLMGECWGQYSTRIVNGVLFHSVWYYAQDPSTLSAKQYNKLGTAASHGCIRVTVKDAKWIYDNCPVGTTVVIYDSDNPGPLGKPEAIKIPLTSGWDPTDPSNNNPWKNTKPKIIGAKNQTIKYGTNINLKKGVTANSSVGLSITEDLDVKGYVNTKKPGKYKITYSIQDALGRTDKETVIFTVLGDTSKPVLKGVIDKTVNGDQVINRDFALQNVTASLSGTPIAKKNIKVTIKKKSSTVYIIYYSVTGSNKQTTNKTATITIDKVAPEIKGVKNRYVTSNQVVNRNFVLKGVSAIDHSKNINQSKFNVTIVKKNGYYKVYYKISDSVGNIAKATAIFTINDGGLILGVKDQTVKSNVSIDELFARKGVTAYVGATDVTSNIKITISDLINNRYKITYEITDTDGNMTTEYATITVLPDIVISGVSDKELPASMVINEDLVLSGVTAKEGNKDVTDKIKVKISDLVDGKYTVTYKVTDEYNATMEVTSIITVK